MAIDYNALGQRIRKCRLEKTWTQDKLSEAVSISEAYMSRIEMGKATVSLTVLVSIAEALDVGLDYLICDSLSPCKDVLVSTELSDALSDCSFEETKKILKVIKTVKEVIHN